MRESQLKSSPAQDNSRLSEYAPFIVAGLIMAHLIAFVYWIYRVAVEKPPERRKTN